MRDVLDKVEDHCMGEYAINPVIDGVNRVFLIYFVQDVDGVWRIGVWRIDSM